VSSFGIGAGFDEALMTALADRGKGDYFFLDSEKTITQHVSKSVHGLLNVVGTETKLKFRGLGGAVVTKVFGQEEANLIKGLDLGDLHGDNVRQVLVELDVAPEAQSGVSYSLEFSTDAGPQVIKGQFVFEVVDDEKKIQTNASVQVSTAIQKNAELMKVVEKTVKTNREEAIRLQKAANSLLSEVVSIDTTGQAQKVLDRSLKALKRLEEAKEDPEILQRQIGYERRLQRRMSINCYAEGHDSDSEGAAASPRRNSRGSPRARADSVSDDEGSPARPVQQQKPRRASLQRQRRLS